LKLLLGKEAAWLVPIRSFFDGSMEFGLDLRRFFWVPSKIVGQLPEFAKRFWGAAAPIFEPVSTFF
jgi:hypothetical protein